MGNSDYYSVREGRICFCLSSYNDFKCGKTELTVVTDIMDADGQVVSTKTNKGVINHGQPFTQNFIVERPKLWSPETPVLYKAVSKSIQVIRFSILIPHVSGFVQLNI